jgi:hypothetical protein
VCLLKLSDEKNTVGVKELPAQAYITTSNQVTFGTRWPPRMAILQELMKGKSCDPKNILL